MWGVSRGSCLIKVEDSRDSSLAEHYLKLTVLRSTPSRFSIEHFLSTDKSTGECHHGMHIYSDPQGQCTSTSSYRPLSKYDIWRSWEHCLWFQNTLEEEYERAAREKRKRLAQGKGVKGYNGLYKKDLASSWDSLPSGPDHRSVSQDIHKHLPTLTKRGTLFRPTQATIDRRQAEFVAFIGALFSDDMPSLIDEIRVSSIVSEFFGLWRSDFDIAQEAKKNTSTTGSRVSLSDSHFSASHRSLPSLDSSHRSSPYRSKVYSKSLRSVTPRTTSLTKSTESHVSEEPRYSSGSSHRSRSRPLSTSSNSSALSDSSSDTSLSSSTGPAIADNVSIACGHSPTSDQFNPILDVLSEEQEILPKTPDPEREEPPEPEQEVKLRPRASTTECKPRRSHSFFGLSLQKKIFSSAAKLGDRRSVRESWQSSDSQDSKVNTFLDGLALVLPHPIKEQKFRASIASVSTFMTTDSANAVIPQTPQSSSGKCSTTSSTPTSTSLLLSDADGKVPFPRSVSPISELPKTPDILELDDLPSPASPTSSTHTAFDCPPSPSCTTISSSALSTTSTPRPSDICIKAIHDTCIILLRVSRRIGLAEVKQRLCDKFINQEKIPLPHIYDVVFVPATTTVPPSSTCSVASANGTDVQVITLEEDWEELMSNLQGNKITLRILA